MSIYNFFDNKTQTTLHWENYSHSNKLCYATMQKQDQQVIYILHRKFANS